MLELAKVQETGMLGSAARRAVAEREQAEKEEREREAREQKQAKEAEEKRAEAEKVKGKKKTGKKLTRMKHKTALTGRLGDSVSSVEPGEESSSSATGSEGGTSRRSSEDVGHGRTRLLPHFVDYYAVLVQMSQVCVQSQEAVSGIARDTSIVKGNVLEMEAEVEEFRQRADELWDRIRELELSGGVRLKQAKDPQFSDFSAEPEEAARGKPHARTMGEAQAVVATRRSLRTADIMGSRDGPGNGDPHAAGAAGRRRKNSQLPLDVSLLTNLSDADGVGSWARF